MNRTWLARGAVLTLFMLIGAAYFFWTSGSELVSLGDDEQVYVLTAQSFAGSAPNPAVADQAARDSQYPPLYPLLLAASSRGTNIQVAHWVTGGALFLAFGALYFWLRLENVSRPLVAAAVLVVAILPGTYSQALYLHSENLFVLCSVTALAGFAAARQTQRTAWLVTAAVFVACASMTRTIGVVLFPALILAAWRTKGSVAIRLLALLLGLAPQLIWSYLHRPEVGYLSSFAGRSQSLALGEWLVRFRNELAALYFGFLENFIQTNTLIWGVNGLILLCVVATLWRLAQRREDAVYAFAYVTVIMLWPFPAEAQRLIWAITPVLLGAVALLTRAQLLAAPEPLRFRQGLAYIAIGVAAICSLPTLALTMSRFLNPVAAEHPEYRGYPEWYKGNLERAQANVESHKSLLQGLRQIADFVPATECVLSIKPTLVSYFGRRRAVRPPLGQLGQGEFEAELKESGCQYLYLLEGSSPSYPQKFYPAARLASRLVPIQSAPMYKPGAAGQEVVGALVRFLPGAGHR